MPKIVFTGDTNPRARNPAVLNHLGIAFPLGEPVDVSDDIADRLRTHSHFTVGESDAPEPPNSTPQIRAVHRGRGSYSVMDGDRELLEGLSKEEAASFNDMSAADRATFIGAGK